MAEHGHQNKSQQEYNELLGMTQSLLGKMSDALSELDSQTDKRNKKLSTQISLTKDIISDLQNEKDLQAAINLLTQNSNNMSSQNFGINQKLVKAYQGQLATLTAILQKQQDAAKILGRVNSVVDGVKDKFHDVFHAIDHGLGDIPFIGEKLKNAFHPFAEKSQRMFGLVADKFKMSFKRSFESSVASGKSFSQATFGGIKAGLGDAGKLAMRFAGMLGPIAIGIIGIGAAIGLGWHRMHDLEKAATDFKTTTGLAGADLHAIEHTIAGVSNHFGKLGITADEVGKIMSDYTTALDGMVIPAESTVAALAVMNKNFGVNAKSASEVNKVFQNMGGFSEAAATSLTMSAVEMANMVGVSPDQVIKDMADNAGEAYNYFRGSPQELVKAAVYAAKMGSSIKDMTASANKLLDFEESITKELEASALLGTNLDFSKAREAAFTGDLLGMQKELTKELANVGDISKMSTYEKQALVDATGQELDTLMNTQRIYNKFGSLDDARLAAANDLIASGKDIANVSEAELEAQTQRLAKQQKMQDAMGTLKNSMSAIGTAFTDLFAPMASMFLIGLSQVAKFLAGVLVPTLNFIGSLIKTVFSPIGYLVSTVKALVEEGFGGMVKKLQEMGPVMATIVGLVGTLAAIWVISILPTVIATVSSLAIGLLGALFAGIAAVWTFAAGLITSAIAAISTMSALTLGIGAIAIIGGIAAGAAAMNSQTEGATTKAESVQDGVISPGGNVISTSPDDFLIATKNPGTLADTVSQGGGTSMEGVIAELRELKAAFMANRNVYIDGQLVTSKIASVASKNPVT